MPHSGTMGSGSTRRGFLVRALAGGAAAAVHRLADRLRGRPVPLEAAGQLVEDHAYQALLTHGPFIGHVTPSAARIWARFSEPGEYRLIARGPGGEQSAGAVAGPGTDGAVVWELTGLEPQARYRYEIVQGQRTLFTADGAFFVTPAPPDMPGAVRIAVGSCAREGEGSASVWRRIASLDPDALVLLGDTPYIDTTDLTVQRTRYGEFAAVPDFASLLRNRPLYATWDDHDFGANDTDGSLAGKENSRRAFVEFHANPSYGDGAEGVYTRFRLGGAEVFLLDTRYFAGSGPSPIAAGRTLLGPGQWEWLRDGLRSSTAPFKFLATGLIWNGAVRPGKLDHWGSYPEEREALFRFIGDEGITGVVLVGGDVHRTRVLRYPTSDLAGYPLTELITSPIHASVIEAANAPHPALVHDSGEPHAFLLLTVDTSGTEPVLDARFQNAGGRELYGVTITASELA